MDARSGGRPDSGKQEWDIARFYDMRFSAEETTEWERLVHEEGMDRDEATETVRAARHGRG